MMLPQSVPGVVRDKFVDSSAMKGEIRPSYCCCDDSLCTKGCGTYSDCPASKYGCNDSHCN
jgi:hypothetical protein